MMSFKAHGLKKEEIDYLRKIRGIRAYYSQSEGRIFTKTEAEFIELVLLDEILS